MESIDPQSSWRTTALSVRLHAIVCPLRVPPLCLQWVELRPSTVKLIAFSLDGRWPANIGHTASRPIAVIRSGDAMAKTRWESHGVGHG